MKYNNIVTNHDDIELVVDLLLKNNKTLNKEDLNIKIIDIADVIDLEKRYKANPTLGQADNPAANIISDLVFAFKGGKKDNIIGILKIESTTDLINLKSLNVYLYNAISWNSCYIDKDKETIIGVNKLNLAV